MNYVKEGAVTLHSATVRGAALIGLATAALAAGTAAADIISIYETGFEPPSEENPGFELGSIEGQDGWIVLREDATALIQEDFVRQGAQALEVVDGDNTGRAQRDVNHEFTGPFMFQRFDLLIPESWGEGMQGQRFEASGGMRLEDADGQSWVVQFGVLKTADVWYNGVPDNTTVLYIELQVGADVVQSAYYTIPYNDVAGTWQRCLLEYDRERNEFRYFFNGDNLLTLPISFDFVVLRDIRANNQRFGTIEDGNSQSIYFDRFWLREDTESDINSEPVVPDSFERIRGLEVSGELPDLFEDDDSRLVTRPDVVVPVREAPVQVEVIGTMPVENPSELLFSVQSLPSVGNIRQQILLWNYNRGEYVLFDSRILPTSFEGEVVVSIPGGPARYIQDGTGQVKALIRHNAVAFAIFPTWEVGLDRTIWQYVE